jgi:hypothetical protein
MMSTVDLGCPESRSGSVLGMRSGSRSMEMDLRQINLRFMSFRKALLPSWVCF